MFKTTRLWVVLSLFCYLWAPPAHAISAGAAGLLSIVPGLGQTVEGNPVEGLGWFGAVVASLAFQKSINITANVAGHKTYLLEQAGYDLWQYNMYDAYRDAKPSGGQYANQSALENYIATFNPLNSLDLVGTPALAAWTAGFGIGNKNYRRITLDRTVFFSFVGMGEEGLFRGFLFPSLSNTFNSKIVGGLTSSLLFSLFHITNGADDMRRNFLQRFAMGCVFSFEADRNKYDLRHNIFAHSWIDIINESGGSSRGQVSQVNWHIPFN